ncbi:fatty acid oxidation complex subunit alpha FadB [Teredinibacter waterburyi]|uniref:fatty acid oxidation complex subunit alpha FadB n=1 Tax=Teredinibacter waterburyi TaxID=1500538 RepID=UPI00165F55CF|nr:fatty acid oxidation complex subunit alpha FadB [Teredinibacter waterburyi]
MIFEGQAFQVKALDAGLVQVTFDLKGESVNKFTGVALRELDQVVGLLEAKSDLRGVLITSGKEVFIVGADIAEFGNVFASGDQGVRDFIGGVNQTFNRLEDLAVPTVAAINGYCLGGGLELCLACDFRLLSESAKIGLPETKLGIIPGWGGTVRLSRLAGLDVAIDWIASGKEQAATKALKAGVVDGVVEASQLYEAALGVLTRAAAGELDYAQRKQQKLSPLAHNDIESLLAFESSKAFVKAQAGYHYPAPVAAITSMQNGAKFGRDQALVAEGDAFISVAQTTTTKSLVGLFLSDQYITKKSKLLAKAALKPIKQAAVLGAGIMGGGIAYQSAYKGTAIKMKDIADEGLALGVSEATKLLNKRVERGRMTTLEMAQVLTRIDPVLSYEGFDRVDLVVEAVVENPKVKQAVLAEVEGHLSDDAILCSNTSTISISLLAEALKRPENFCGMHFFNPVHAMPLVEVIRGKQTSDAAVAATVAYANQLGKKAIVVNDCPGFLVNRVLFPYFAGFSMLLRDGADFQQVDKVMERWGWPMGPAYLMDVVGIDTGVHAEGVMAQGFPERMGKHFTAPSDLLFAAKRLGQKNGHGFYDYAPDKRGKPQKNATQVSVELLAAEYGSLKTFSDEEIIARMMVPMATELVRCLEEGVVATAAEADMALVYGLGFPPFRGGIFRWLDEVGIQAFVDMAKPLAELGPLYAPTVDMLAKAADGSSYYTAPRGDEQ